jgi:hypothetical protein
VLGASSPIVKIAEIEQSDAVLAATIEVQRDLAECHSLILMG